ncbi:MAG: PilN domain-containing protein [Betaproteobacteria bacterium]|nr:PilN domain-containing protein [Betaproteobacteria bacterium]
MIRINLLPWREARRKAHNLQFYVLMGMVAGLAASIILLVHGYYATRLSTQTERNKFLTDENTKLDKEIEEIKKLKEEIQALLSRKQVIETLQADRAQTVYLLEQLVRQAPDGVYLKSIRQTGSKVNLSGYAQSNARVSTLMRNLEASPYLENPDLVEIKVASINNKRLSEFIMNVSIRRQQSESDAAKGGAGKGGAGKGAAAPRADAGSAKK